jgi:hypothetical protein
MDGSRWCTFLRESKNDYSESLHITRARQEAIDTQHCPARIPEEEEWSGVVKITEVQLEKWPRVENVK